MQWCLVHTKPKQERHVVQSLERQGWQCYLPTLAPETLHQESLNVSDEPLFPRYLFVRLGQDNSHKSRAAVRSTKGVSRLVNLGVEPAIVGGGLVAFLQAHEASIKGKPHCLFKFEKQPHLNETLFVDIESIYRMVNGQQRVMALIELLSKPVSLLITSGNLSAAR